MRIYRTLLLTVICIILLMPARALAVPADVLPDAQLLVNQTNPLPSYLEPQPLASVNAFARGNTSVYLREDAAQALQSMLNGLKEAGIKDIYVNSGYRNFVRQGELYTAKVASYRSQGFSVEDAQAAAARWVLPAGESEHQTGLAVDLSCSAIHYDLIPGFATTPAGLWLAEHCTEYGFVIRYTEQKEAITGVASEPWHFRYVGAEHAAYMREHDLCLEEYHALLKEQGRLSISDAPGGQRLVLYSVGDNSASLPGLVLSVSLARKNSGEYIITTVPPLHDTVNHWGEQQIRRLYEMHVVSGYEDGSFRPENAISRGEFVTAVSRLPIPGIGSRRAEDEKKDAQEAAEPIAEQQPLPYLDINAAQYYYQPLEQCFRAALVQPMLARDPEPHLFKPEQALLRREAALMLSALLNSEDFTPPYMPTYYDVPPAAEALFRSVELLTARGVFQGDGFGLFYPDRQITRAEMCAMLTRLLDALEDPAQI